jgi:ArsR family transcriptional regulator, arsenate/arsenite/antimonite-responsive transcriptional repressor
MCIELSGGDVMETVKYTPEELQKLADQLKVLAEPNRLLIFQLLMEGVQCNCELGDKLQMPPNLISHHLRVLSEAQFINAERDSLDKRWVYYSINRQTLDELNHVWEAFFNTQRIQPRKSTCGPQSTVLFDFDLPIKKS